MKILVTWAIHGTKHIVQNGFHYTLSKMAQQHAQQNYKSVYNNQPVKLNDPKFK
jgi:hypothetical protein